MSQPQRVVILGAGSAGCVLAARLSESPDREVILVEEGDWLSGAAGSAGSLSLAYDQEASRSWEVRDGPTRLVNLRAGRVVGGSSAVNGCYFIRPTDGDLAEWARVAGAGYSTSGLARYFSKLESDLDFGDEPGHGNSGPVPVERDFEPLHPASEAFRDATLAWGASYEPDKNARGTTGPTARAGVGPVPFNSRHGIRADLATCYLAPLLATGVRSNLKVMTGSRATRVLLEGNAAVGVEVQVDGGPLVIGADQVVLAAGAIGSPALLLASGIGPGGTVRALGIDPVADLPGVGANLFNHPTVDLGYEPTPAGRGAGSSFMQLALHTSASEGGPGDFELMATRRPYGSVTGRQQTETALSLRTTLLRPLGRGRLTLAPVENRTGSASQVVISHQATGVEADRVALRAAVRFGDELLRSPQFRTLIESRIGLTNEQLESDAELDVWIRDNAAFSFHQTGTCAMGTDDEMAVVDPQFRVRGVRRLAVADASVIPVALSRGPAATVVALAEAAAEALSSSG